MKVKSLSLAICSMLLMPIAHAAPLSFQEAWDLLQQQNNSLAAQRANVERYAHLKDATQNLNLPSVSVGANFIRLDQDVTLSGKQILDSSGGIDPSLMAHLPADILPLVTHLGAAKSTITERDIFTSSIRAIWPIFTGGRITAAQDAAAGREDEAQSQLAMEIQARYEDLAKYYFSVVLAKEVLATRIAVEEGLTQHRDNALKLEQQGQIAHVERLQADASLDKAKVERKKAQKTLDIAQSALTQILGATETVEPSGMLFINTSLPPMHAFIEQTLNTYPGLSLLDAKEKQASSLIKAEQGKYYPEVYLYGDYSLHEDDSLASQMKPDWLVGVGVNIPLIENTGRSEQVKAANSAVNQVRYLKAQAKQDLSVLVEKTYLEAEQALEEVTGLNSSLNLAQENLRLRQKAFSQGLSTSVDVVDAELYLASIRTQQSLASFNYLISLNKLLALSSEMSSFSTYHQSAVALSSLHQSATAK
ncbi:TolC family protein [Vibrio cholerae]|uniref:TolC family protein n=1 Tax=Vibrio paracholerae TaxID=650003 RepID=A0ABD7FSH6_9VIBR|nr:MULTISPECIES: TolC family protein [Vibrio]EGR0286184.1 TolC family protein [Vibrio cholerae]EGR0418647.1 TolC family protein [Vibrio cholerae]EGZ6888689.1 TolC family protein [Vibrio cholerae]EJH51453.1 outer membrane efflux family protein [Vibrio cholerae HC-43B1]EJL6533859.1 TolC family protein [Vibrio cholerae]